MFVLVCKDLVRAITVISRIFSHSRTTPTVMATEASGCPSLFNLLDVEQPTADITVVEASGWVSLLALLLPDIADLRL